MARSFRILGPVERLIYLRTLPLFGSLPARHLAVLARQAEERELRRDEVLLEEGTEVDSIYILIEGSARVSRRGQPFRLFGPRDAVGVIGLLARTHEGVRAVALEDCVALEIRAGTLYRIFEEQFSLYHHVLRETARLLVSERSALGLPPQRRRGSERFREGEIEAPTDLVDRIRLLCAGFEFAADQPLALAQLARGAREEQLGEGDLLWRAGEPARAVFVSMRGAATGLVPALAEIDHQSDREIESRTTFLRLSRELVLDVLEDHFELAVAVLSAIARQLLEVFIRRAESQNVLPAGLQSASSDASGAQPRGASSPYRR